MILMVSWHQNFLRWFVLEIVAKINQLFHARYETWRRLVEITFRPDPCRLVDAIRTSLSCSCDECLLQWLQFRPYLKKCNFQSRRVLRICTRLVVGAFGSHGLYKDFLSSESDNFVYSRSYSDGNAIYRRRWLFSKIIGIDVTLLHYPLKEYF